MALYQKMLKPETLANFARLRRERSRAFHKVRPSVNRSTKEGQSGVALGPIAHPKTVMEVLVHFNEIGNAARCLPEPKRSPWLFEKLSLALEPRSYRSSTENTARTQPRANCPNRQGQMYRPHTGKVGDKCHQAEGNRQ